MSAVSDRPSRFSSVPVENLYYGAVSISSSVLLAQSAGHGPSALDFHLLLPLKSSASTGTGLRAGAHRGEKSSYFMDGEGHGEVFGESVAG